MFVVEPPESEDAVPLAAELSELEDVVELLELEEAALFVPWAFKFVTLNAADLAEAVIVCPTDVAFFFCVVVVLRSDDPASSFDPVDTEVAALAVVETAVAELVDAEAVAVVFADDACVVEVPEVGWIAAVVVKPFPDGEDIADEAFA